MEMTRRLNFFCLLACLAALAAAAFAPTAGAKAGPGALDPSFGNGGVATAKSIGEASPTEFAGAVVAANGDVVLEARHSEEGAEPSREIQALTPGGALDPGFGRGGKLTVEAGAGIIALADGDLLIGVHKCGGELSSVLEVDASGTPVASFGKDGCGAAAATPEHQIAVDPKGRILAMGTANYCPPCGHDEIPSVEAVITRLQPDGSLDPGFGKDGVVGTHVYDHLKVEGFATSDFGPSGLAATAGGGVLIAKGEDVIGLTETGGLDPGFGKGGVAVIEGHSGELAVGADGSIFVLTTEYSDPTAHVTKLTASGALDASFGTKGAAPLPFESRSFESDQLAPAPDGGVFVGAGAFPGEGCRPCGETPAVARFSAAGRPDPAYGNGGVATTNLPAARLPSGPQVRSLAVAADGSAFLSGSDEGEDAFVAGFTPTGAPQAAFGEGGTVIEHREREAILESTGFFEGPKGGFTVAAQKENAPGLRPAYLVRFAADGEQLKFSDGAFAAETLAHGVVVPGGAGGAVAWNADHRGHALIAAGPVGELVDESYGKNGTARFPKGLVPHELVPAPDGGAAIVGEQEGAMAVFRVGPTGRPVPGFGHGGLVRVPFPGAPASGYCGLVEADGDIAVAGAVGGHTGVVRLLPNGHLDRHFGHDGRVRRLLAKNSLGAFVAPSKGGLVIAAEVDSVPSRNGGLIRLRRDGRIDRSFGHRGIVSEGAERPPFALMTKAGHIVVATNPTFERGHHGEGVELRAYDANGAVDRAFGEGGVTYYGAGTEASHFNAVAANQQPDGKIVVAGSIHTKTIGGPASSIRTEATLIRFLLR